MSWMQSAPHGRRSRAKASAGQGRCWSAGGSPEEMTGAGLAEKGRAAAWLDRMRRLQLPGKLPARTLQSHLHNSHHLNSRNVWKRCHWMALVLCWVLGWSVFSFWIVSSMRSQIVEMRREVLANMCEERARLLQDQVKTSMNKLQALTIVVSTFHDPKIPSAIDQVSFARYAERTAFERRPLTSGLAYAPRVMHAERELFEQQQAWSIKMVRSSTKTMNSSYERSPEEEEYAPIIFTQDAYKHVVSVDMLSGNEDRENVLRARESGKVALSAPFKMHNNHTGVILTYAVYSSKLRSNATAQDRVQSAIGYLGGIFDIETHVDSLLHQLAGKQSIMLNLYDTSDDSPISMYGTNETADTSGLCHTCTLNFGDPSRKYQMHCRFLQRPPWPWLAIVSSCGSLVVSLLIGYIVKGADVIQAKHGLMSVEQQDKLNDTERSTKFITNVKELSSASIIQSLSSRLSNLNIKLGSISLLGLVLCILLIAAFDRPFNQGSGKRRGDGNIMLKKFGWSRRRLLVSTLHGNTDGKASKYQEETTQIQNGTVRPHLQAHKSNILTTVGPWIALVSVIMVVLGIAIWLLLWCNRRKRVQQNDLELLGGITGPRRFQLHELAAATSNFADEKKLGRGGFGHVYKGYLRDQDLHVAIKVLSKKQSSQGLREFKAEVKVMAQLRHRNIVKLVGWCDSKKRLLLVYELMAQGSLDKHLYDPEKLLTWQQRFKIVLDLGSGLLYLHRDCENCIVHGDIKPANVMLDASHNAKLGDFGLARLVEHGGEPQTTQVVAGTPGYIDPEFVNNRWPRTELDVYSFGVVLLEIACGKPPASRQPNGASSLLAWVHGLYDHGLALDAADRRLNGEFDRQQMERVIVAGLWCAHQDSTQRPSIVQAMDVLRSADAEMPVIPAAREARHIRSMEEQAYSDLPVEDRSVRGVTPSAYFTSKDSVYLLAEE